VPLDVNNLGLDYLVKQSLTRYFKFIIDVKHHAQVTFDKSEFTIDLMNLITGTLAPSHTYKIYDRDSFRDCVNGVLGYTPARFPTLFVHSKLLLESTQNPDEQQDLETPLHKRLLRP
jgi:hypothetical protein